MFTDKLGPPTRIPSDTPSETGTLRAILSKQAEYQRQVRLQKDPVTDVLDETGTSSVKEEVTDVPVEFQEEEDVDDVLDEQDDHDDDDDFADTLCDITSNVEKDQDKVVVDTVKVSRSGRKIRSTEKALAASTSGPHKRRRVTALTEAKVKAFAGEIDDGEGADEGVGLSVEM